MEKPQPHLHSPTFSISLSPSSPWPKSSQHIQCILLCPLLSLPSDFQGDHSPLLSGTCRERTSVDFMEKPHRLKSSSRRDGNAQKNKKKTLSIIRISLCSSSD